MKLDPEQTGQHRNDLAEALKILRKASGLSGERLAVRTGMSQSKVSRIENGRILPSVVDVERILRALGVDRATSEDLLGLTRVANTEYRDVRASVRQGLHHRQQELAALEAGAVRMRYFLPTLITGLLQTPEYMRAAMSPPVEPASGDVSKAIAIKLSRQAVLYNQSKKFDFLLTESAVRWQLCEPAVMSIQLDRLVSLSRLPNVRIGVIPLSERVAEGAYHTYVVYDERMVTIELFTGQLVLRDPKDAEHYRALYEFFSEQARWGDEGRQLLTRISREFMQ
ncbi:helix-turn-helix transcriptional regulator [Streptosporangium subroseum]|uniref:helix-turn-helix domain-containing protein n=1 Tax=Streptosporangium subroseum TaxID=106412 RepID=UPI003434D163